MKGLQVLWNHSTPTPDCSQMALVGFIPTCSSSKLLFLFTQVDFIVGMLVIRSAGMDKPRAVSLAFRVMLYFVYLWWFLPTFRV
jgi:hypothetical protein